MTEYSLNIYLALDSKNVNVPFVPAATTAEDVCVTLCKQLGIGPLARHLFALRHHGKQIFLIPSSTFPEKNLSFDFRIRYKVAHVEKLKKIDCKAYDYYFHQARGDVLDNKIPDLIFERYRKELVGLGISDMYRVMLEKDIPRETVESDYKKYIPKEVIKRHAFFIKKPIHDTLGKIKKEGHDAWYVKAEYLRQLEIMVPEYLAEEYKALMDQNGAVSSIIVRVSPFHPTEPGLKYYIESKKEKCHQICTLEDLVFVSLRKDGTVEISRKTGIPFYLKFNSVPSMLSFVSLLDGYYRLTAKWTFNICKDVITPSLQKLHSMKCHGPVGGEFSYAKLEQKRGNHPGCFILRESESKYNVYYIDVCVKDSLKPMTYKMERLTEDEFIFNDDLSRYHSIQQLMSAYSDPEAPIYLAECLPPSEYDKSPLLLCQTDNLSGDALTDSLAIENMMATPLCINNKDLQVYKGRKCLKWNKNRKKIRFQNIVTSRDKYHKSLFPDESLSATKKACRNPDGDIGGPWCYVEIENTSEVEKEYCEVPFCHDETYVVLTKDEKMYTHYTYFSESSTNFSFAIKLWDPDSYMNASARLVLSLVALPVTGNDIDDLGIGLEIYINNHKSALRFGNSGDVEYEDTPGILKAHKFTYFTLTWWHNIISLFKDDVKKPIFMADYKHKNNLMGHKMNMFRYYAIQGTNTLWNFPYCELTDDCVVHTTVGSKFQQFFPLRATNTGQDIAFHIRAFHSAYIMLVPSPVLQYPHIKVMIQRSDNFTRVLCTEYENGPETVLIEITLDNLLNYWKWKEFTLSLFGNELQLYVTKDTGTYTVFIAKHNMVKQVRWFSPSSENAIAQWAFYCYPNEDLNPPKPWLPECVLNSNEPNYKGTQDVTSKGLPCLPWCGDKLLPAEVKDLFDKKSIFQALNYCRDPKDEQRGTYCYTISENAKDRIQKEYCQIRRCKSAECKVAGTGNDYIGKVRTTRSNRTCQHWVPPARLKEAQEKPEEPLTTEGTLGSKDFMKLAADEKLSESDLLNKILKYNMMMENAGCVDKWRCLRSIENEENGPSEQESTTIETIETTYASDEGNVTITDDNQVSETEKSDRYIDSDLNTTNLEHNAEIFQLTNTSVAEKTHQQVIGNESKVEALDYPYIHEVDQKYFNNTLYADLDLDRIEDFCRNPSRNIAGSWCYTLDPEIPMDVCNIRDCDQAEECTILAYGHGGGQKKEGQHGTLVYRSMWRHAKGKKLEVAMRLLKQEYRDKYLKEFLDLAGQWAFLQSSAIVKLFGVTLSSQMAMVLEYVRLGPLDEYLRKNKANIKQVDLIEAASNLASALWHLEENGIVHGNIRCRKLLVHCHDENAFTVKLIDPGLRNTYASTEVHWIPIECYSNLDFAWRSTPADVWAFGTTLWELFTFGEKIKHTDHVEAMRSYASGKRLPQPPQCPNDIYQLMRECWDYDPHRRKQPQAIMRDINQLLYEVYNSRRIHSYAKMASTPNTTDNTFVEELLSVSAMSEVDSDLSHSPSMNSVRKGWQSQDFIGNEDALSCDFSNMLSTFNFSTATTSLDSINSIQSIFELGDDCNVVLQGRIGQGFYGEVYKGTLEKVSDKDDSRQVAVKKLKKSAVGSCLQDFEREISIMKSLKHPNIVEILGVLQEPEISLVMEYVQHGSLQSYLKIYKESLSIKQLLQYSLEIASGMDYLGRMNIVHRDLAARNILVVDENHVKISDFGLAQVLEANDYYILKTNRELPIKWYAPESLQDGKFSTRSDMWSYGVTLYEMFSYGDEPKLLITSENRIEGGEQQILLHALQNGTRLPCPAKCPKLLYATIMYPCWKAEPHSRPTFSQLCAEINDLRARTD